MGFKLLTDPLRVAHVDDEVLFVKFLPVQVNRGRILMEKCLESPYKC